jgi:3-phosphoglycerate kinase
MKKSGLDPRLRLIQQAEIKDKTVLVRVDHNVVGSKIRIALIRLLGRSIS